MLVTFVLSGGERDEALSRAVGNQVDVLRTSAGEFGVAIDAGAPVDAARLRQFAQLTSSVNGEIDSAPEQVPGDRVYAYAQAIAQWRVLFDRAVVSGDAEAALVTARTAADDAMTAVARYFNARPDQVPAEASSSGTRN